MKKISLILAVLAMSMCMSARSYVAMTDTSYVAPEDTAEVNPPVTPPEEEALPGDGEVVDTMSYKGFALNATELSLRVGETFQLELIWDNPEWVAEHGGAVTYSCGTNVASVDDSGLIIARSQGETYVYVSANGIDHTCFVSVYPGEQESFERTMTLPLGEFLEGVGNEFEVTLTDDVLRLTGSFWGHACIPSELEYEIIGGAAFFEIYTNYEDSTCTDGWQGSFMVRQTIDVSFEGCTSDVYNVYVNNVHYETYEEGAMNAIVYRAAPNRYGTDTNVNLNIEGDAEALTAEIGEDSIHITGYYLSNCGMGLYCVAEEHGGSIALTFYEVGVLGANCVGYHPVDFSIPRLAEQVNEIYACDSYDQSIRLEAKIIDTSVGHISTPAVDAPYYDLQGRKVAHPTRGVYIRNGKKVIL
jgi:hypothetical protein